MSNPKYQKALEILRVEASAAQAYRLLSSQGWCWSVKRQEWYKAEVPF